MCKFESLQKEESRSQSVNSSKACSKPEILIDFINNILFLQNCKNVKRFFQVATVPADSTSLSIRFVVYQSGESNFS